MSFFFALYRWLYLYHRIAACGSKHVRSQRVTLKHQERFNHTPILLRVRICKVGGTGNLARAGLAFSGRLR